MGTKTKVRLGLGAVFAGVTAATLAILFVPLVAREFWLPVALASAVFAFIAFAFNSVRWAGPATTGFVLTMMGFNYSRLHATEPDGIAVLVTTLVVNAVIAWVRWGRWGTKRGQPHAIHTP